MKTDRMSFRLSRVLAGLAFAFGAFLASAPPLRAEVSEVRLSKGYGVLYLPLMVMEQKKLLEKHAAAAGLGDIKTSWFLFDGGNNINDAMLAAFSLCGRAARDRGRKSSAYPACPARLCRSSRPIRR